ncbi:hypothetical protein EXIGLDRAFT_764454 [Exidia glandulosa HHB12029]|uniref:Uncharacterized protein n=1 Tax=Exidia glandulosa HHB12029 TaxID=1314781 RepID=A0A165L4A8_EXIGL|nr:hypothetical protein EXIGLDRAFT_764454 [Exidia glandulosa HHB12029]
MAESVVPPEDDYSPPPANDVPAAKTNNPANEEETRSGSQDPPGPNIPKEKPSSRAIDRARKQSEQLRARVAAGSVPDIFSTTGPSTHLAPIAEDAPTPPADLTTAGGPANAYGLSGVFHDKERSQSVPRMDSRAPSVGPAPVRVGSVAPAPVRVGSVAPSISRADTAPPPGLETSHAPTPATEEQESNVDDLFDFKAWLFVIKAYLTPTAYQLARRLYNQEELFSLATLYTQAHSIRKAERTGRRNKFVSFLDSAPVGDLELLCHFWTWRSHDDEYHTIHQLAVSGQLDDDERESLQATIAERKAAQADSARKSLIKALQRMRQEDEASGAMYDAPKTLRDLPAIATLNGTPQTSQDPPHALPASTGGGPRRSTLNNADSDNDDDDDAPISSLRRRPAQANDEVDELVSETPVRPTHGGKQLPVPFPSKTKAPAASKKTKSTRGKGSTTATTTKTKPKTRAAAKAPAASTGPPSPTTQIGELDEEERQEIENDPDADGRGSGDDEPRLTTEEKGKGPAANTGADPDKENDAEPEDNGDDDSDSGLSDSDDDDRPLQETADRAVHARAWLKQIVYDMKALAEYAEMQVEEVERLVRGGVSSGVKSSGLWNVFQRFWAFQDPYPPLQTLKAKYKKSKASAAFKQLAADVGLGGLVDILSDFAIANPSGTIANTAQMQLQHFRGVTHDAAARAKYLYSIHGISSVTLFSLNNFSLNSDATTWAVFSDPAAGFLERLQPMAGQNMLNMFRAHTLYRESDIRLQVAMGAAHGRAAAVQPTLEVHFGRKPDLPRREVYGDLAYMKSSEMSDLMRDYLRAWCDSVATGLWPMRVWNSGQPASDMRCFNSLPSNFIVYRVQADKWRWYVPIPTCDGLKTDSGHPLHAAETRWEIEDFFADSPEFRLIPSRAATEEERSDPRYRDRDGNGPDFVVWSTTPVDDAAHPLYGQSIVLFNNLTTNSPTAHELRVFTRVSKPEKDEKSLPRSTTLARPQLRISRRAQSPSALGKAGGLDTTRTVSSKKGATAAARVAAASASTGRTRRGPSRNQSAAQSSSRAPRPSRKATTTRGRNKKSVVPSSSSEEDEAESQDEDEDDEEEEEEWDGGSDGDNAKDKDDNEKDDDEKDDDEQDDDGDAPAEDPADEDEQHEEQQPPPPPPPPKPTKPAKKSATGAGVPAQSTASKKRQAPEDSAVESGDELEDPDKAFFRAKKDVAAKKLKVAPAQQVRKTPLPEWRSPRGLKMEVVLTSRKKPTVQAPPASPAPAPQPSPTPGEDESVSPPATPTPAAKTRAPAKKKEAPPPRQPSVRPRTPSRVIGSPQPVVQPAQPAPTAPVKPKAPSTKRPRPASTTTAEVTEERAKKRAKTADADASTSKPKGRAKSVSFAEETQLPRSLVALAIKLNGKDIPSALEGIPQGKQRAFKSAWKDFFAAASAGNLPSESVGYTLTSVYDQWKRGVKKEKNLTAAMKEVKGFLTSLPDPDE